MRRFGCLMMMLVLSATPGCGKSVKDNVNSKDQDPATIERSTADSVAVASASGVTTATTESTLNKNDLPMKQPMNLQNLKDTDLVSLGDVIPNAIIDIVFARHDNPFHYQFFKENKAYLRCGTAKKLAVVARDFERRGLRLKIWSSYRPFPVQVKMFQIVKGNADWVSDPYHDTGKKAHVRAVAVDCTLVDAQGRELEMPTPYLDFEHGAERMKTSFMNLPPLVLANRKLLHDVMVAHGLEPYTGEWWHFQDTDWAKYPVIEMNEFSAIHHELLVDEMLTIK